MAEPSYNPERRPITSRRHPAAVRAAAWLAARGVSPNAISTGGMVAGIAAGAALALTARSEYDRLLFVVAAVGMQLRLLANMFDGMVAIETGRASPVGELFNEVPDRVSDTAILVGAGYAAGSVPWLGYAAALAAMFTAYIRAEGKVAGARQEFCGPMAKPQRMAVMTAAAVLVAVLPDDWRPHFDWVPQVGIIGIALAIVAVGAFVTAVRRLLRIGRALSKGNA